MEDDNRDYTILEKGIGQILKKIPYPPPIVAPEPCVHVSDGFIYNKDVPNSSIISLLQCVKCGIQYEILNATGAIIG